MNHHQSGTKMAHLVMGGHFLFVRIFEKLRCLTSQYCSTNPDKKTCATL